MRKHHSSTIKQSQIRRKISIFFLIGFMVFTGFFAALKPVQAQMAVVDTATVQQTIWQKIGDFLAKLWRTAGSVAFNRTLTTALNKVAYDTANWIGSGKEGQKPLFVTQGWGAYLNQIGDEAGGQFVETFVNNLNREDPANCDASLKTCQDDCAKQSYGTVIGGIDPAFLTCVKECSNNLTACAAKNISTIKVTPSFNVCQPSSLSAKLRIGLGLIDQSRPQGPNCTFSQMTKNWDDYIQKQADFKDPYFFHKFADFFDPRSNDLGIYIQARADLASAVSKTSEVEAGYLAANRGWLDVRNIAGDMFAPPGSAEEDLGRARRLQETNIGKITGDAFVDAANVFINQLAMSSFDKLLRSLADQRRGGGGSTNLLNNPQNPDPGYNASALRESSLRLLQPNFDFRADYSILSSLVVCPDAKNPGPDNCVIDDRFMQGISEQKTVAEAIRDGYLRSDWQLTADNNAQSAYTVRNISILRKYRILPLGWEEAVRLINDPQRPKKATLQDLVSCFDTNDKYNTFSADFQSNDQAWCQGLIDPNWVLKAPLNYCRKEGFGGQILNKTIIPGNEYASSSISILRADNYCADNQTCIKESASGGCDVYGYCTEELRTWNSGAATCEPIFNTCQAFTSSAGAAVSYLQNTLDYGDCNADNAGCREYSFNGAYATSTAKVSWAFGNSAYFNKNLSTCGAGDEGCTELLRAKSTWGANLVMNADFSRDKIGDVSAGLLLNDWRFVSGTQASIVNSALEPGVSSGKAMKVVVTGSQGGISSVPGSSLLPADFQTTIGEAYTVSVDVYIASAIGRVRLIVGSDPSSPYAQETTVRNSWQKLTVTRPANSAYSVPSFAILGDPAGTTFYFKNLKFEVGNWNTGYSPYGSFRIYQKLLPSYFEEACYINITGATKDYRLRADAPTVCKNFVRRCNKDEAGCELYTSVRDNFKIPAQVTSSDYCRGECVGYDAYIARASYFSSPVSESIIPSTHRTCSAAAVGCTEFTNLDALSQGGEQREYYTFLKQCVKPAEAQCATFYSWEGTGSGYQLRSHTLKQDGLNRPAVTSNDSALCNQEIYNLPLGHPDFNSDCKQFYNAAGQIFYHLNSRTITCSDNCHPYRMSGKNVDQSITVAAQCTGTDKNWDSVNRVCNVCLNGGAWNSSLDACVYQAIPGEGQRCQAVDNGCREYSGARGANMRLVATHDFDNGLSSWSSNCSNGISSSPVANSNNGSSLFYNNAISCNQGNQLEARSPLLERVLADANLFAQLKVGYSVRNGSAYTVRFMARAANNTNLNIFFINRDTQERAQFNAGQPLLISGGNEWRLYQVSLEALNHTVSADEMIAITANGNFYLDDFVLSEITDRYYLVKGSGTVPGVCYYDVFDNYRGADYNLGCAQYTDRSSLNHNLHRFSSLCADSSVGCEQMIDTKNYAPYSPGYWYQGVATSTCAVSDPDCVRVDGDSTIYAVYDPAKQCGATNQGCSRLGQSLGVGSLGGWTDVFRKNNPNQYEQILCASDAAGCDAWTNANNGQMSYFKNPGAAACIYRAARNPEIIGKSWYKVPVKRCDLNGNGVIKNETGFAEQEGPICSQDADCAGGRKCIADTNDYVCSFSYDKTIGLGGSAGLVPTPTQEAGLCTSSVSSCSEFIDPVSRFMPNLVKNPNFSDTCDAGGANSNCRKEGWGLLSTFSWSSPLAPNQQVVRLQANKLYILKVIKNNLEEFEQTVSLNFINDVQTLGANNKFGPRVKTVSIHRNATEPSLIFNSLNNQYALLSGGDYVEHTIEVKELVVDYWLAKDVDKTSCNGLTEFDDGCVLFNERSVRGASGLAFNNLDPYNTGERQAPQLCVDGINCAANQLIKVRPDRVCSKWLDCVSFVQDPNTGEKTCYALGECDRLDDKGECVNFIEASAGVVAYNAETNKNATGYSMLGRYNFGQMREVGELVDGAKLTFEGNNDHGLASDLNKVISSPDDPVGTDYPAEGLGYLMIRPESGLSFSSPAFKLGSTSGPTDYYVSYLVNTKKSNGHAACLSIRRTNASNADLGLVSPGADFGSTAPNGWERKVNKFTVNGVIDMARIGLIFCDGSSGSIYFDDIRIEPVLQTGEDQYVFRDCRLYPEGDSLSCVSKNQNVVKNGLEGYCVYYDPLNPGVCLTWYPVDRVGTTDIRSSTMGYTGDYPLHYCAEVGGNFELVEMRKGYFSTEHTEETVNCDGGSVTRCEKYSTNQAYGWSCPEAYNMWVSYKRVCTFWDNVLYRKFLCIPKEERLLSNNFKLLANSTTSASPDANWEGCIGHDFYQGLAVYDNGLEGFESSNLNPPIRVYDYDEPPNSLNDLKTLSGNDNRLFRITCNRFVQVVDGQGQNKAWSARVGSTTPFYATTTPDFFVNNDGEWMGSGQLAFSSYGRNNADLLFGAAKLPTNFPTNYTGKVPLRNQYDASSASPLAGRPYGCQPDVPGCKYIGYCSNDHKVFCIFGQNETCSGGTCQKLWSWGANWPAYTATSSPYTAMLNKLFLESYAGYKFNPALSKYESNPNTAYPNYALPTTPFVASNTNCIRSDNTRNLLSFCAIFPSISNAKLYYGSSAIPLTNSLTPSVNVSTKGIYRLEFNSTVDAEQQPLRRIEIDWGDGYTQTITGQDHRPDSGKPHVFYHNYTQTGAKVIKIKIFDNWGFYAENK